MQNNNYNQTGINKFVFNKRFSAGRRNSIGNTMHLQIQSNNRGILNNNDTQTQQQTQITMHGQSQQIQPLFGNLKRGNNSNISNKIIIIIIIITIIIQMTLIVIIITITIATINHSRKVAP